MLSWTCETDHGHADLEQRRFWSRDNDFRIITKHNGLEKLELVEGLKKRAPTGKGPYIFEK